MGPRERTWLITGVLSVVVLGLLGAVVAVLVRNLPPGTTVAGVSVSSPEDAQAVAEQVQRRLAGLPVVLSTDAGEVEVPAGTLGAGVDTTTVALAAREATGLDGWLAGLTGGGGPDLAVPLTFTTGDAEGVADRLSSAPVDGAVEVTASGLRVTDAVVGVTVAPTTVSSAFREAAAALEGLPLEEWPTVLAVDVAGATAAPTVTQVSVDAAVARIEALTEAPITLTAQAVPEDAQTVDGVGVPTRETVEQVIDGDALLQLLAVETDPDNLQRERLQVVATAAHPPQVLTAFLERATLPPDVHMRIEGRSPTPDRVADPGEPGPGGPADQPAYGDVSTVTGQVVAELEEPGLEPDLEDTVEALVDAALAGEATVAVQGRPVTSTDEHDLGVVAPVSTWTTFYEPGQGRVTNIHRIAEIVDGTLVPPGGNYELNHAVGERTTAGGFVPAGAILEGEFITDVGGGVSQFATTFFNAMWFSGIDIITHTPHSFWFDRYPAAREATIDYPGVDLELNNNTPYWILIDTAVTDDSVTVTFWSTPHFEVSTTMGERQPTADGFRMQVSRRSVAPDGAVDDDQFTVDYRLP